MKNPLKTVAEILYKRNFLQLAQKENPKIRESMSRLYPGGEDGKKYREFVVQKLTVVLTAASIGMVMSVCVFFSSRTKDKLMEGAYLARNEWGRGSYQVTLSAETETGQEEIKLEVEERSLNKEERDLLLEKAGKELPTLILGKNESLSAVSRDLNLITHIEGYPFSIAWKSSQPKRIRADGKVYTASQGLPENMDFSKNTNLPENTDFQKNMNFQKNQEGQEEEILLTAIFSYEEEQWEKVFPITLKPQQLTRQQVFLQKLQKLLSENDKKSKENIYFSLPEKIENQTITWKEKKEESSGLLLLIGCLGAALGAGAMDKDLEKREEKRRQEILADYPAFITRLQLYMGAGLTVKNAFLKMGEDYQEEREAGGKICFLYEEILIVCRLLSNGTSEEKAYGEWGNRCRVKSCKKLSFLLVSHLRQGNDRILHMLSEERNYALEDEKNRAKRQGEEAGTKMLLPMMLMLAEVMVLILLPAFMGF